MPADEVDDDGDNGTVLVYAEPDPAPGPSKSKDVLVTPRRPAIDVAKSPGNKLTYKEPKAPDLIFFRRSES